MQTGKEIVMYNRNFTHIKKDTAAGNLLEIFIKICVCFASALFIWWGWNVLAPYLNAPSFSYWEIFAMRMALAHIVDIIRKK